MDPTANMYVSYYKKNCILYNIPSQNGPRKGLGPLQESLSQFLNFELKNRYILPFSLSKDSLEETIPFGKGVNELLCFITKFLAVREGPIFVPKRVDPPPWWTFMWEISNWLTLWRYHSFEAYTTVRQRCVSLVLGWVVAREHHRTGCYWHLAWLQAFDVPSTTLLLAPFFLFLSPS